MTTTDPIAAIGVGRDGAQNLPKRSLAQLPLWNHAGLLVGTPDRSSL